MSKKACKKKDFENHPHPEFECKKCGSRVNKEEKVCHPRKWGQENR